MKLSIYEAIYQIAWLSLSQVPTRRSVITRFEIWKRNAGAEQSNIREELRAK